MSDGISVNQALDLGTEFAVAGNHVAAIEIFRGVLIADPENFEATQRLGTSLFETDKLHEAMWWFWRGRKMARKHPLALMNYGLCLSQLGHPEEGLPDLERAAALAEDAALSQQTKAQIFNNLGNTLERLERHKEALPILDKGVAIDPDDPFPHYNRGIVLLRLNRHREAIEALDRSLELRRPGESRLNDADAYYNRAMAHLLLGELKGFADYEGRLSTTEMVQPWFGLDPRKQIKPGEDIAGKTIIVHCEQGLGDTIQFARFLRELYVRGANIKLIAHTALRSIFKDFGFDCLEAKAVMLHRDTEWTPKTPDEKEPERFDGWIALMSIPYYLGLEREEDIPPPWVFPVETERVETWAAHLPPSSFRVGVCWAGNFRHKNDRHRSIPLKTFSKLFDAKVGNALVDFVSVQQVRQGEEEEFDDVLLRRNVRSFSLADLRDTAAVLLNCDLVITADTAVAHLSATLGIPTWILIPKFGTDWRWQLNRTDSPWYPSATLYRQPAINDWRSVLDRVAHDLVGMAAQRAAAHAA